MSLRSAPPSLLSQRPLPFNASLTPLLGILHRFLIQNVQLKKCPSNPGGLRYQYQSLYPKKVVWSSSGGWQLFGRGVICDGIRLLWPSG